MQLSSHNILSLGAPLPMPPPLESQSQGGIPAAALAFAIAPVPVSKKQKSFAPLEQFLAHPNSLLLVEARDEAAAAAFLNSILHRSLSAPAVFKLSPRLFFTQGEASGRYWRFQR